MRTTNQINWRRKKHFQQHQTTPSPASLPLKQFFSPNARNQIYPFALLLFGNFLPSTHLPPISQQVWASQQKGTSTAYEALAPGRDREDCSSGYSPDSSQLHHQKLRRKVWWQRESLLSLESKINYMAACHRSLGAQCLQLLQPTTFIFPPRKKI